MTHKLLLADDSVTIQRVVELTFSGEDVRVVTVGDGEQAIARIPDELPDIVLADIGMPKRSGYDVSAFVKGRPDLARIPVVLLAGAFEPVDEARAREVKSDGVLVKPFEPQQVIARVRELIESSRLPAAPAVAPPPPSVDTPPSATVDTQLASAPERVDENAPAPTETAGAAPEPGLDDYFDRLDQAFARLGTSPALRPTVATAAHHEVEASDVPTMEQVLAGHVADSRPQPSAPDLSVGTPPTLVATEEEPPRNLVADMFAALFAMEQGDSAGATLQLPPSRREASGVSDELVDEVTRRVLERLAPEAASELVAQIVSEVAERLIREEIARIKAAAAPRL